ncbi:MAG: tetratricopeptide repeat protein [Bacteroidota bacterium]
MWFKKIKTLPVLLLMFFILMPFFSISQDYNGKKEMDCKFHNAYVTGEMEPWPDYIDELENTYSDNPSDELLYDIVEAYYGYVAYTIGLDEYEESREYMKLAEPYLDKLEKKQKYKSAALAFKGAFIAFEIGMNKAKAVFLGPKSMRNINKALELDPKNSNALIERGNAEFHMPRMFGGSYKKAAEYFNRAVNSLEKSDTNISCNWIYMNALAWLAQSYDKSGKIDKAENTYQKILEKEPEFDWVRNELYPEFRKSHK